MKNYGKKILITIGIVGGLSLLAVPIVSCSTNFNGTVITINNNGISITKLKDLTSDQNYKLSPNSSSPAVNKMANGTNTVNFPPTITYNNNKQIGCVITLITQNGSIDNVSRITGNSTNKTGDVYSKDSLGFNKCDLQAGNTTFEFNLSLINPPSNTFKTTEYYFSINLINL